YADDLAYVDYERARAAVHALRTEQEWWITPGMILRKIAESSGFDLAQLWSGICQWVVLMPKLERLSGELTWGADVAFYVPYAQQAAQEEQNRVDYDALRASLPNLPEYVLEMIDTFELDMYNVGDPYIRGQVMKALDRARAR